MEKSDFFNNLGKQWDENTRDDMNKVELIIRLLNIRRGNRILDVGTGTGILIPVLTQFTNEDDISAIDFAPAMIDEAKRKFAGTKVAFITDDVMTHPFAEGSFDFIICYHVFPHFDDQPGVVARLSGLLKKGGLIAVLHSMSRRRINVVHAHSKNNIINIDHLPPAEVVGDYMKECGLKTEILIDNPEMYMVCARKADAHAKMENPAGHEHDHTHVHEHEHTHGYGHMHEHAPGHDEPGPGHKHEHVHGHEHEHGEHGHESGYEHGHEHGHTHESGHKHEHGHEHTHED